MSASSPMKPIYVGKRIKLYRAIKGVHLYPGIHLWIGHGFGHLRLWPPRIVRG